jgi:hypothetical protein
MKMYVMMELETSLGFVDGVGEAMEVAPSYVFVLLLSP